MTAFARASGSHDGLHWQWEVRSVNGKSLDVRSRLAPGFEALEVPVREAIHRRLKRGNLQASLACDRAGASQRLVVNEEALEQATAIAEKVFAPPGRRASARRGASGAARRDRRRSA